MDDCSLTKQNLFTEVPPCQFTFNTYGDIAAYTMLGFLQELKGCLETRLSILFPVEEKDAEKKWFLGLPMGRGLTIGVLPCE